LNGYYRVCLERRDMVAGPEVCCDGDRMWPDQAAPHPEMVRAGMEALSEGTILLADGYGPCDGGGLRGEEDGLLTAVWE
jgi:hypothetical protein